MGQLFNYPKFRAFKANGTPLSGGKLYTYLPGTTTPKATYSDYGLTTPNTNPVILDVLGEANVFLSGFYKMELRDANGVVVWTMDNMGGSSYVGSGSAQYDFLIAGAAPNYQWERASLGSVQALLTSSSCAVDSGAVNAYVVTLDPAPSAYTVNMRVTMKVTNSNTGGSTINVNGLGVKTIKKSGVAGVVVGDLLAGGIYDLLYDGTYFQLLNPGRSPLMYGADSGSANAYAITLSPILVANLVGLPITFLAGFTNTGAATLNINGLGAVAIKKGGMGYSITDLTNGDIMSGQMVTVVYDGTYFQLIGGVGTPIGTILPFPIGTVPDGYLECDGSSLLRSSYASLFGLIGTTYGSADGTHFYLPDYRGQFLRGWAHGSSTYDPDRTTRTNRGDGTTGDNVGTKQAFQNANHLHGITAVTVGGGSASGLVYNGEVTNTVYTFYSAYSGGNQANPNNINVMYIIKY